MTHKVSTYDSYGSPITVSGVRPAEGSITRFAPFLSVTNRDRGNILFRELHNQNPVVALSGEMFRGSVHMTPAEARELAEALMAEAELIDGEQDQ